MFVRILITLLSLLPSGVTAIPAPDTWIAAWGQNIRGFGATDENPTTLEWGARWTVPIAEFDPTGSFLKCSSHEFWFEPAWAFIASPRYHSSRLDNSWIRLSFMGAFRFGPYDTSHLFITLGGGPTLLLTDIPGMGSRLNGHYQLGVGFETRWKSHPINLELRYHHVSNLNRAQPNTPLNGFQILTGVEF